MTKRVREWGVTVTFKNPDGELLTITRTGKRALADACDAVEAWDPSYKVVCISTPASIYADLSIRSIGQGKQAAFGPEAIQLGHAKRAHMLHPSLRGRSDQSRSRWHGR